MSLRCWIYGHKWQFGEDEIICSRCSRFMVKVLYCSDTGKKLTCYAPEHACFTITEGTPINFRVHTIVPIETLQVAEAACREAGYNKTARELRRCLTAEK